MQLILPVLLLLFIYTKLSRHALDPLALFCYFFFFFYAFRGAAIAFELDGPYPDYLFFPPQTSALAATASQALLVYLFAFVVSYLAFERASGLSIALPVVRRRPSMHRQLFIVCALTFCATLVSLLLLARYGGVSGVIRAGKVTNTLAGSYELRVFPSVGAVMSASFALAVWKERHGSAPDARLMLLGGSGIVAAILNSAYVLLWGSRQAVAIVLLIVLAGGWLLRRGDEDSVKYAAARRTGHPSVLRLLAVACVLVLAITGLRLVRDSLLIGHTTKSLQGQSTLREISVASNTTYFDALLLAVRDWPSAHPYRGGEDFIVGAEGIVPRAMWPGKPANVRPGSWFRQVYEPTHPNGWPLGAVGDWYLNFGLLGVLVGGGLSGLLYRVLMATWWRVPWSSFNVAALMCIVAFVVPTGIDALTLLHWVQWGFPLLLCAGFINRRSQSRARRPELVARTGGSPTTP